MSLATGSEFGRASARIEIALTRDERRKLEIQTQMIGYDLRARETIHL